MTILEFLINLLWLISIDSLLGFVLFIAYKYFDYKYFSELEIITLKEENNYLKQENRKKNGTSTFFDKGDKI